MRLAHPTLPPNGSSETLKIESKRSGHRIGELRGRFLPFRLGGLCPMLTFETFVPFAPFIFQEIKYLHVFANVQQIMADFEMTWGA